MALVTSVNCFFTLMLTVALKVCTQNISPSFSQSLIASRISHLNTYLIKPPALLLTLARDDELAVDATEDGDA